MENPIKMDDLGGKPTIFGNIHISHFFLTHIYIYMYIYICHINGDRINGSYFTYLKMVGIFVDITSTDPITFDPPTKHPSGNIFCDLFGMVSSRDPNSKVGHATKPNNRGSKKGQGWVVHHLVVQYRMTVVDTPILLMEEILHFLYGFIHPRWLFRISAINGIIYTPCESKSTINLIVFWKFDHDFRRFCRDF